MGRWLGFLLMPCALHAQDRAQDPRSVAVPVVVSLSPASVPPTLTVILTKDGGLLLSEGATPVNLEVLGRALAANGAPKEKRGGVELSTATVLIRADNEAPWQHVQWILLSCAGRRIYRIRFAARTASGAEGVVDATLPLDAGHPEPEPEIPPGGEAGEGDGAGDGERKDGEAAPATHLVVHVVARKEGPARFGEREVEKPTEIRHRYGDRESSDLKDLARWAGERLAAAKKAGTVVECEIAAGHKVPFGKVVAVLDTLCAAGAEGVRFRGTKAPGAELGRAIPLPYPERNYDGTD